MGLAALKDSVPDIKHNPEILAFLSSYADIGFMSLIMFVGVGTILTLLVQSSSAAMALTLVRGKYRNNNHSRISFNYWKCSREKGGKSALNI